MNQGFSKDGGINKKNIIFGGILVLHVNFKEDSPQERRNKIYAPGMVCLCSMEYVNVGVVRPSIYFTNLPVLAS